MSDQRWADNFDERFHEPALQVRHVQPYEAVKTYRCPGCDHEIPPGLGHEVVVPLDAPADRRHWHSSCWQRSLRHQR